MSDHDQRATSHGTTRDPARRLQDLLLSTEAVEDFLAAFIDAASVALGDEISAGVMMDRDGHVITVACSDESAARYDEEQYRYDEGPCLSALRSAKVILVEDLAADYRFGPYRRGALALGVRSSMSLPLYGGVEPVGALNLCSRSAHGFSPAEQAEAVDFADEASRALNLVVRIAHDVEITDELHASLISRTVIDRAIGVVCAQNRCDSEDALAMLRATAAERGVELRFVAAERVAAVSG